MSTIITRKVNGHGPYKYKVEYENGSHTWTYLGRAADVDVDAGPVTNDDGTVVESPDAAPETREHYEAHLDRILDGESFEDAGDWYDDDESGRLQWRIDRISEYYQTEHDLRVAFTNAENMETLELIIADIEEARDAGFLDGVEKVTDARSETLQDKHGTTGIVNAEYEPEPRDIMGGDSLGYRPTLTINADTYRDPDTSDVVQSYGDEIENERHALWHELGHHQHLEPFHDRRVDIEDVMDAGDGETWDKMHEAMEPWRDELRDEFSQGLEHDPIEFAAEAWARGVGGDEELSTAAEEALQAVQADEIIE